MPTLPDYYRLLGLSPKAGLAEIKRRYRFLALKFHPDRNPRNPEAASRFREIAEAYQAICLRRARPPAPPEAGPEPQPDAFRSRDFVRENFRAFFEADEFAGLPSFGGPNFRYDLQIPFLASLRGLEQDIQFRCLTSCSFCQATGLKPGTSYQDCPACQGRGRRWASPGQLKIGALCDHCQGDGKIMAHPCPQCRGQGYRLQVKKYRLAIPPGVEDGTRILFHGEGGEGFQEGPPGHLVVVVHVEPHAIFTRRQNDLYCTVDVSLAQAVLGDSIEVPTPFGPRLLELPRGARSGQSFLFPGLGVPSNGTCHPGNLVVTIQITDSARFADPELPGRLQPGPGRK